MKPTSSCGLVTHLYEKLRQDPEQHSDDVRQYSPSAAHFLGGGGVKWVTGTVLPCSPSPTRLPTSTVVLVCGGGGGRCGCCAVSPGWAGWPGIGTHLYEKLRQLPEQHSLWVRQYSPFLAQVFCVMLAPPSSSPNRFAVSTVTGTNVVPTDALGGTGTHLYEKLRQLPEQHSLCVKQYSPLAAHFRLP
uniref:(northern house mosquito) hypothetical protein n=1 Tax=Culex pipiens TaxID=7175 RepID=A0A8D8N998_CULPI